MTILLVTPVPTIVLAVAHPGLGDAEAGAALVLGSVANFLPCNMAALATLVLATVALLLASNIWELATHQQQVARPEGVYST